MLKRQKIGLALLRRAKQPVGLTTFVKWMFLLRQETFLKDEPAFYDFLPYKYGPFSFALYQELNGLRQYGYVSTDNDQLSIDEKMKTEIEKALEDVSAVAIQATQTILDRYGKLGHRPLLKNVYERYPWYRINSEIDDIPGDTEDLPVAEKAVYTAGYEGKSVDRFFDDLLKKGIKAVVDVRFNPLSRKYGFSKKSLQSISQKLGLDYHHYPALGIPGEYRADLTDFDSYQRLFEKYEREMLPKKGADLAAAAKLFREIPAVLLCVEKEAQSCHRGRLAKYVSKISGLPIVHL